VITREQTRNPGATNIGLVWLRFIKGSAVPAAEGLKNSIGLDRLVTWNEVRCAMWFSYKVHRIASSEIGEQLYA
jgi:hypothetical protein